MAGAATHTAHRGAGVPPPSPALALAVRGSGPVATAFALFARRQGFAPGAIGIARTRGALPAALATRLLALSLGSWQLLGRIARLPPAAPIRAVEVRVIGHPGRTTMTAEEMRVPALGYTVRYGALLASLDQALDEAFDQAPDHAFDRALEQAPSEAPGPVANGVIVHAEGDTGEDARTRDFAQSALLVDVRCELDGGGGAFECFTPHGPLALLPLDRPRRMSLVWCAQPHECERRAGLASDALADELNAAFGTALGRLEIDGPAVVAPLARRARRVLAQGGEVWIGNAAQALHPVAGQGLNLGLRDAFELARALGEADRLGSDAAVALARYARGRMLDRGATIGVTDTLAAMFAAAPLRPLQSLALAALDLAPLARSRLARRFMFGLR